MFVPFISDVRVGSDSYFSANSFEEGHPEAAGGGSGAPSSLVGSPPTAAAAAELSKLTPPSSPHPAGVNSPKGGNGDGSEAMDLQLDYWTNLVELTNTNTGGGGGSGDFVTDGGSGSKQKLIGSASIPSGSNIAEAGGGGSGGGVEGPNIKFSIKSSIWFMQIARLGMEHASNTHPNHQPTFTMQYRLKEKKQKGETQICY